MSEARTVLWAPTFVLQCYGRWHLPLDMDPDGSIQQPLWSRRKLASSTVMDVQSLRRPLPVGLRINTSVHRTARRGGMGHSHLQIKLDRGIINGRRPAWSYPSHRLPCQHSWLRGKGRPGTFEEPSLPLVFLLSPICNPCSPLVYKREGRAPH